MGFTTRGTSTEADCMCLSDYEQRDRFSIDRHYPPG